MFYVLAMAVYFTALVALIVWDPSNLAREAGR